MNDGDIVHDKTRAKALAKAEFLRGLIFVAIGLIITIGSYKISSGHGGGFVVAGGSFIFGSYELFHGLYLLLRPKAALRQLQSGKPINMRTSALKMFGIVLAVLVIAVVVYSATHKTKSAQSNASNPKITTCDAQYKDLNTIAQANSKSVIATSKDDPGYSELAYKQNTLDQQVLDKYNECQKLRTSSR